MKNTKIRYLYNSGFSLETQNHQFIFDYYKGTVELRDKKIIVFSSHSHPDHFSSKIFQWENEKPDIVYVLSSDISVYKNVKNIYSVSPDESLELGSVKIHTLGSTDLGVSFLVEADSLTVFHAGDLNWWYWWDDTPEEIRLMENAFKKEIDKLSGKRIDIAFFPVDPRLKHNYGLGGHYFIETIKPEIFVPMHFGQNYGIIDSFIELVKGYDAKVIKIYSRDEDIFL